MTYEEAEAISREALLKIFPILPRWGLHNPTWSGQIVDVGQRRFYVAIAPWLETFSGREFHLWPAGSTPASHLAVRGFLTISGAGLSVEPQRFFGAKKYRKQPKSV